MFVFTLHTMLDENERGLLGQDRNFEKRTRFAGTRCTMPNTFRSFCKKKHFNYKFRGFVFFWNANFLLSLKLFSFSFCLLTIGENSKNEQKDKSFYKTKEGASKGS